MNYEDLLQEAEKNGLIVKEITLKAYKGRIKGNRIAIKKDLICTDKRCTLAEELGHYHTTVGNILDQNKIENRKQEFKARRWAVKRLIRVEDFINAFNSGVKNRAELAEFLEVTEGFINIALDHFKGIYGYSHKIGEYTIIFNSLYVYKSFD